MLWIQKPGFSGEAAKAEAGKEEGKGAEGGAGRGAGCGVRRK